MRGCSTPRVLVVLVGDAERVEQRVIRRFRRGQQRASRRGITRREGFLRLVDNDVERRGELRPTADTGGDPASQPLR